MSQVLVLDALRRQLRKYLKETRFAAAWAPQLEGVLSAVRFHTQHNHGATAERAVQGLEVEMAEWTRLTGEGEAWSGLVLNVIARIDASLKAEAEVAATRYEQAHVGLALLRACFGAMETLGEEAQESVSAFCAALLSHVLVVLKREHEAERDAAGLLQPARRSEAALAEQDAVQPALAALGCADVLASMRRLPLGALRAAALEAKRCLAPVASSVDEATLLSTTLDVHAEEGRLPRMVGGLAPLTGSDPLTLTPTRSPNSPTRAPASPWPSPDCRWTASRASTA